MSINVHLYTPYPWQRAVHDGIERKGCGTDAVHVVVSKRQVGKSMMSENILLKAALETKNRVILYITPTLSQSRKVFKELAKYLEGTGLCRKKNETLLELEFINGSQALFRSSEQKDTLRGYTVDLAILDEAAFLSADIWSLVAPMLEVRHGMAVIVSTPRFTSGFFWDMYSYATQGEDNFYLYDWSKFDTLQLLSKEKINFYRKILPKVQFDNEVMGKFADAQSVVFGDFKGCISDYKDKGLSVYFGIDYGNGTKNDDTVVCGIDEDGHQICLEKWNDLTSIQSAKRIALIFQRYAGRIGGVMAEGNSLGTPQIDILREEVKGNVEITSMTTTNKEKAGMVSDLQVAFEQKAITLMDNDIQTNELAAYSFDYNTKTGFVTYNAPSGLHDDCCMALMYAWRCRKEMAGSMYSFSIRR